MVALAVFLEAAAFYALAVPLILTFWLLEFGGFVSAFKAVTLLAADLAVSEALAVFRLAEGFNAVAAKTPSRNGVFEQIVDFVIFLIARFVLINIELMCPNL